MCHDASGWPAYTFKSLGAAATADDDNTARAAARRIFIGDVSRIFLCAPLCWAMLRTAITKFTNQDNNIELVGSSAVQLYMTAPNTADETPVAVLEARMDGRISSMEATFASFVKLMDERQKVSDARFDRIEAMPAEM